MPKKIIIDTNWWISFIVSKKTIGLPSFFFGDFFFYFSDELIIEIRSTLQYLRIKKRINHTNLQAFLFFEQNIARILSVDNTIKVCRDTKDNFLLHLAGHVEADFLITNDEDLLSIGQFQNTLIVTLAQFLEIINK